MRLWNLKDFRQELDVRVFFSSYSKKPFVFGEHREVRSSTGSCSVEDLYSGPFITSRTPGTYSRPYKK